MLVEAAYVPDTSFGVKREGDLLNHLPGNDEAPPLVPQLPLKPAQQQAEEIGKSPTYLGVAQVIPRDPTGGPDFALSIGYQIMKANLKK